MRDRFDPRRVLLVLGAVLLPVVLALVTRMIVSTTEPAEAGILPSVTATATPSAQPTPHTTDDERTGGSHDGSGHTGGETPNHGGSSTGGGGSVSTPTVTASDDHGG